MTVFSVNCLPEEILEEVFLHLPLGVLHWAKKVCSKWQRVIESATFKRTYEDHVELVVNYPKGVLVEIVDSDKNTLCRPPGNEITFGRNRCPQTSLMLAYHDGEQRLYVCNVFNNQREAVPWVPLDSHLPGDSHVPNRPRKTHGPGVLDRVGIFGLRNGHYKLVFWSYRRGLWTLEKGGQGWFQVRQPDNRGRDFYGPAAINTSMFNVRQTDILSLMEYDTLGAGHFSSRQITGTDYEILRSRYRALISWKGMLYFVILLWSGLEVQMWRISTSDGAAMQTNTFEVPEQIAYGRLHNVYFYIIEDNILRVHFRYKCHFGTVMWNIANNLVESYSSMDNGATIIKVPVKTVLM